MKCFNLCWMACAVLIASCNNNDAETPSENSQLFKLLSPADTKIDFINQVKDGDKFNILTYRNFYNGGGVGIGDINNDSLPDIYFTANQQKNRLYLNKGNFVFEDITEKCIFNAMDR